MTELEKAWAAYIVDQPYLLDTVPNEFGPEMQEKLLRYLETGRNIGLYDDQHMAEIIDRINAMKQTATKRKTKVRVNITLDEETHEKIKEIAASKHTNVSQLITDWTWK